MQTELTILKAEISEKEASWLAERDALLQPQQPQQPQQTTRHPKPVQDPGIEVKLREQLAKKDKLVRALRDIVKKFGVKKFGVPSVWRAWGFWHIFDLAALHAEAKLIQAEQQNADHAIHASSVREAEKLSAALATAKRNNKAFKSALDSEQKHTQRLQAQLDDLLQEKSAMQSTVWLSAKGNPVCSSGERRVPSRSQ